MGTDPSANPSTSTDPDAARPWVQANMHAGWGSAPRIAKKLEAVGFTPAQVEHLLVSVAAEQRRRLWTRAALEIAAGVVLILLPIALAAAQSLAGEKSVDVFYMMPVAGVGSIGHALYLFRYARTFSDRSLAVASGKSAERMRRNRERPKPSETPRG